MALLVKDIKLPLNEKESLLSKVTAKTLGIPENAVKGLAIKRISLDARKKNDICFIYTVEISLEPRDERRILKRGLPTVCEAEAREIREVATGSIPLDKPIIVVGMGPGGLFAAYTLAKHGYKPIVIERGEPIERRTLDVDVFWNGGRLREDSNLMYGEGGAGAFSDGKLTTRIKDSRAHDVIDILADHGAPKEIRLLAKPHIGTDILVKVVRSIREDIVRMGGDVRFSAKLVGLEKDSGDNITSVTVEKNGEREKIPCSACVLATGQGARDTYHMLYDIGLELLPKAFAVGVRIEHPRELIDRSQYGEFASHPRLGAAEYHLADKAGNRGVYSFCMCPGGFVVPAASGPHQLVVNGMSPSNRGTKWSNSGMVVETRPEDLLLPEMQLQAEPFPESNESLTEELILRDGKQPEGTIHTLAMMRFQEKLEQICWQQGNMRQTAPSQRMVDFTRKKLSYDLPATSYSPGLVSSPLHFWMPSFLSERLSKGFQLFGKSSRGFLTNEAVMIAVETRTSSPVRIVRDKDTLQHLTVEGLFPCGEGAGYAGGIVSAGIDGERCAEAVANYLNH